MPVRKTHDQYVRDLNEKFRGHVRVLDTYVRQRDKLRHVIVQSGDEFYGSPKWLLSSKVRDVHQLVAFASSVDKSPIDTAEFNRLLESKYGELIVCVGDSAAIGYRTRCVCEYKGIPFYGSRRRLLDDIRTKEDLKSYF